MAKKHSVEKNEILNQITSILGREPNEKELQDIYNSSDNILHDYCKNSEEYIVKQVCKKGDVEIKKFIRDWKNFFVENMDPEEIPSDYYNVNYEHTDSLK